MGRSRASAKQAGSRFERILADTLNQHVDDRIDRAVKRGAADRGDIANVRASNGMKLAIEAKDYGGRFNVSEWLTEAEIERVNASVDVGCVVAKRRGKCDGLDQVVFMTVRDLVALLTGVRPA